METFQDSFSFSGDSAPNFRICTGMAMGLQRTVGTLPVFIDGRHSHHVDELLPGRMERSGRRSPQRKF